MQLWLTIRGFVAGAVAFVACPCHLPLTLPLLLALTTGTAVGGWLASNSIVLYAFSTILFIGGLIVAAKWLLTDDGTKRCDLSE